MVCYLRHQNFLARDARGLQAFSWGPPFQTQKTPTLKNSLQILAARHTRPDNAVYQFLSWECAKCQLLQFSYDQHEPQLFYCPTDSLGYMLQVIFALLSYRMDASGLLFLFKHDFYKIPDPLPYKSRPCGFYSILCLFALLLLKTAVHQHKCRILLLERHLMHVLTLILQSSKLSRGKTTSRLYSK